MTFTVPRDDIYRAEWTVNESFANEASGKIFEASDLAKVSVVGAGMRSHQAAATLSKRSQKQVSTSSS